MTGPDLPDWDAEQTARARYLDRVGTPIERIAQEAGVPASVARSRIDEAVRRGPVVPVGMIEAMDVYLAFLGIDGAVA
ncbi:hypothetical protein [Aureimonas sp. AU40]|uniref:hypothetical protein n=1 Tax=Aureimonas sp. AU40 TaxID=1637747 RepID=UPI000781BE23|nr:hypothetical protein [Aureimonas sp. AU40]